MSTNNLMKCVIVFEWKHIQIVTCKWNVQVYLNKNTISMQKFQSLQCYYVDITINKGMLMVRVLRVTNYTLVAFQI